MKVNKNKIKTRSRQLVWLFMALFCVVFSSAVKKIIQIRADQKVSLLTHRGIEGPRSLTQNIKDGSREKHEIQSLVPSARIPNALPGFVPSFVSLLQRALEIQLKLATHHSSGTQYNNRVAFAYIQFPDYLFIHKLQV